jgi:hypothetical protein
MFDSGWASCALDPVPSPPPPPRPHAMPCVVVRCRPALELRDYVGDPAARGRHRVDRPTAAAAPALCARCDGGIIIVIIIITIGRALHPPRARAGGIPRARHALQQDHRRRQHHRPVRGQGRRSPAHLRSGSLPLLGRAGGAPDAGGGCQRCGLLGRLAPPRAPQPPPPLPTHTHTRASCQSIAASREATRCAPASHVCDSLQSDTRRETLARPAKLLRLDGPSAQLSIVHVQHSRQLVSRDRVLHVACAAAAAGRQACPWEPSGWWPTTTKGGCAPPTSTAAAPGAWRRRTPTCALACVLTCMWRGPWLGFRYVAAVPAGGGLLRGLHTGAGGDRGAGKM